MDSTAEQFLNWLSSAIGLSGKDSSFNRADLAKFENIEHAIKSYDRHFDFAELRDAIKWARNMPSRGTPKNADDFVSDPLTIVENLVAYGRADRETLLTGCLYAAFMPIEGAEADSDAIDAIVEKFQDKAANTPTTDNLPSLSVVQGGTSAPKAPPRKLGNRLKRLISNTLSFRALNLPSMEFNDDCITDSEKHKRNETIRLFRLTSLWAARDPRAILIAGMQNAINLLSAIKDKDKKIYSDEVRQRLIINAEQVYAPLLYIAGYEELHENLRNLCFQLKDLKAYQQIRHALEVNRERTKIGEVKKQVKEAIVKRLEEAYGRGGNPWVHETHFQIEFREKSPASIYEKILKKNAKRDADNRLSTEDLADLLGARVILKLPVLGYDSEDRHMLDDETLEMAKKEMAQKSLEVHEILSSEFGRKSKRRDEIRLRKDGTKEWYSYYQERFAQFALAAPRAQDEKRAEDPETMAKEAAFYPDIADWHFVDYVNFPPLSGVRFVKDLMMFRKKSAGGSGKNKDNIYWDVECQIVDEFQYDVFKYGPKAGHIYYKTDLASDHHVPPVRHWFAAAKAEVAGHHYDGPVYAWIGANDNEMIQIDEGMTLAAFARKYGIASDQEIRLAKAISDVPSITVTPDQHPDIPLSNGMSLQWDPPKLAA